MSSQRMVSPPGGMHDNLRVCMNYSTQQLVDANTNNESINVLRPKTTKQMSLIFMSKFVNNKIGQPNLCVAEGNRTEMSCFLLSLWVLSTFIDDCDY